jgi:hypothetical protein
MSKPGQVTIKNMDDELGKIRCGIKMPRVEPHDDRVWSASAGNTVRYQATALGV